MTVQELHRKLSALIEQGQGRMPVTVNKASFRHALEPDGAVVLDVRGADIQWVPWIDDDGGVKLCKDGSESGRHTVVLHGGGA